MSTSTTAQMAFSAADNRALKREGGSESAPPEPRDDASGPLKLIASYIPSEALVLHTGLLGALQPNSDQQRWLILGVAAAALVLLAILTGFSQWKVRKAAAMTPGKEAVRIVAGTLALGLVGLLLWAGAGPGNPVQGRWEESRAVFPVLASFAAAAMPLIAFVFGLRPATDAA